MKKMLLVAAVAGLAMASCKKPRNCECTFTDKTSGEQEKITYSITTTKKKIKAACDGYAIETSLDRVACEVK